MLFVRLQVDEDTSVLYQNMMSIDLVDIYRVEEYTDHDIKIQSSLLLLYPYYDPPIIVLGNFMDVHDKMKKARKEQALMTFKHN